MIFSSELRIELERTLGKPYFTQRRTLAQRASALSLLDRYAEQTDLTESVEGAAPDPDDDHVLAAAVSASADYLITGDKPLQSLGVYRDVRIISPREFLDLLNQIRGR